MVPLSLVYDDRVLRDGVDIDSDTFLERLRQGDHHSTSQPPPAVFQEAYGRGISLLQGLLVLKAAELAELAWPPERILAELDRIRDQSGVFFTVDTFDRLIASGRLSRGRAWLGTLLDIKPILRVGPAGSAEPISKVRGYNAWIPKTLDLLGEEIGKAGKIRFGVVHVDAPEVAEEIRAALLERFGPREILVSPATPAIATHIGRRAWGLAYMIEDD